MDNEEVDAAQLIEMATDVTAAWLENAHTRATLRDVTALLGKVHATMVEMTAGDVPPTEAATTHEPAVSVRKSLASRDSIISLIDGKPYRTLRRHLAKHGLTPDEYRTRYGLKPDYPMTAPAYSEARSAMAKERGLGRKPKPAETSAEPKRGRGRPKTTS